MEFIFICSANEALFFLSKDKPAPKERIFSYSKTIFSSVFIACKNFLGFAFFGVCLLIKRKKTTLNELYQMMRRIKAQLHH